MAFRIITADERLSAAENKTSLAIFGPPGVGKTTLLKSLPPDETVCLDLEAGMKSVQDWRGASIPVRSFTDFRDLAVLIGGPDPAQHPQSWYGTERHAWLQAQHRDSGIEGIAAGGQGFQASHGGRRMGAGHARLDRLRQSRQVEQDEQQAGAQAHGEIPGSR